MLTHLTATSLLLPLAALGVIAYIHWWWSILKHWLPISSLRTEYLNETNTSPPKQFQILHPYFLHPYGKTEIAMRAAFAIFCPLNPILSIITTFFLIFLCKSARLSQRIVRDNGSLPVGAREICSHSQTWGERARANVNLAAQRFCGRRAGYCCCAGHLQP